MFPLEFRGEINHEETRVMGLLSGESCMILTSTVFDWSTRVPDRRTDGQTDGRAIAYTRYSIYAVARKNLENLKKPLKTLKKPKNLKLFLENLGFFQPWPYLTSDDFIIFNGNAAYFINSRLTNCIL